MFCVSKDLQVISEAVCTLTVRDVLLHIWVKLFQSTSQTFFTPRYAAVKEQRRLEQLLSSSDRTASGGF